MANTLITDDIIAKEGLRQLENNLVMANLVHRDYQDEFVKIGDTVRIRKPVRFTVRSGATYSAQDVTEGRTTVQVSNQKGVDFEFTSSDLTLKVEEFSERYIKPAMIALAQDVDSSLTGLYSQVWNTVGTAGTTPNTYALFANAPKHLDIHAVPTDMRSGIVDPDANYALSSALTGVYVTPRAEKALRDNIVGRLAGAETFMSQSVQVHTAGTQGGTPLVNGAVTAETYASVKDTWTQSIATDGWSNSITNVLRAGDVITIAAVYSVNPVTKQSTGVLQRFLVTAAANSNGSGQATLVLSPPIITSGAYQTVNATAADNAAITVLTGASAALSKQNLVFHKNALALVVRPLEVQSDGTSGSRTSANGLSVRFQKQYDISNDAKKCRFDILYGVKAIYPELACRLQG